MTDRAWRAGDLAAAPALGTRPADREASLTESHGASAVALRAGLQPGALRGATPAALGTSLIDRQRHRDLPTESRDPERNFNYRLERFSDRLIAAAPAEDRGENVPQTTETAEVIDIELFNAGSCAGRTASATGATRSARLECAIPSHRIVLLALFRIRKNGVRFGNLLEAVSRRRVVGIGVGVILLGESPIGLLDVLGSRRVRDAEDLIEVLRHV